jgi:hypothetical protein
LENQEIWPYFQSAEPGNQEMKLESSHKKAFGYEMALALFCKSYIRPYFCYGWIGQEPSSGFCDLAPSILHYNWF